MRATSSRRLAMLLVAAPIVVVHAWGCGDAGLPSMPISPSSPSPTAPPASPDPDGGDRFLLSGRVTETPPTHPSGISGAIVTITSGPEAGRSATTNSMGFYSIPDVMNGSAVRVSASGYLDSVYAGGGGPNHLNFQLMPVPETRTATITGSLDAHVGTCSDGVSMKPCHIVAMPIHNAGPLDATLTWQPGDGVDLDLTLFDSHSSSVIARSTASSSPKEIQVRLNGGALYELRVTYSSGKEPTQYVLRVTRMN